MMRTARAQLSDVLYVLKHLSEQNAAEHKHLGLSQWEILKRVRGFMQDGAAYVGSIDGVPQFVFGIIKDPNETRTWFLATKEYFSLGAWAVIHARRFLRGIVVRHGELVTGSCSPHPDMDRWFKLLGFHKIRIGIEDGVKWFRYPAISGRVAPSASVKTGDRCAGLVSQVVPDVLR